MEILLPYFLQHDLKRITGKRLDLISVICGIIYVLHEGIRWRALPAVFECFSSVYTRFSHWEKRGLLKVLFDVTAAAGNTGKERSLDASQIKVHQDANTKDPENKVMRITRGGRNTKLHAIRLSLTAWQVNDCTQASPMTSELQQGEILLADKAYDADALRTEMAERGVDVCIPPLSNRRKPAAYNKETYKNRHHVENYFQRAKRCRRIGTH